MMKFLRYFSFGGSLLITILGIVILLIENDTGERPHGLVAFTLALVFITGATVIFYIIKNKGI